MLYEFVKNNTSEAIEHRIAGMEKQAENWLKEYLEATRAKEQAIARFEVANHQVNVYAKQIEELKQLYQQKAERG